MSDFNNDLELESLLGGRAGPDPEQWEMFVDDLRGMASVEADASVAASHIASAAETARLAPASRPAATSTAPIWRRRTVFTGLITTIFGKVLAGAMAVAAATAGAAAAGVLPDPVQGFVDEHVFQQEDTQKQEQISLQIREQIEQVGELAVQTRENVRQQVATAQQQQQGTELGQQQQQGTEQGQQQQQQQNAGICADSDDPDCEELVQQQQQQQGTEQGQQQQQQGDGACADPDDPACEEPAQQQSQTQQGPGECEEGPCGDPIQDQTHGTTP